MGAVGEQVRLLGLSNAKDRRELDLVLRRQRQTEIDIASIKMTFKTRQKELEQMSRSLEGNYSLVGGKVVKEGVTRASEKQY